MNATAHTPATTTQRTTAAVIIPTIASKRTRQKVSRQEEVRQWGNMVRRVITNCEKSIAQSGYTPVIVLVNNFNPPSERSEVIRKELSTLPASVLSQVSVIERPGAGWMGSILKGADHAIKNMNVKTIVSFADDFETEAPRIGRLLEPLNRKDPNKRVDFTYANWDQFGHTFPPAQYLKERIGSLLVSFANPRFKIRKGESFLVAAERSAQTLQDIQSQSGLMAMNATTFTEAQRLIDRHFSGQSFGHSGLDPIVILSALNNPRRKLEGVFFPRRYEHFYPRNTKEQQGLVAGRKKMFEGAINATEQFLKVTGQTEKLAVLPQAHLVVEKQTAHASKHWKPGLRKLGKTAKRIEKRTLRKR